MKKTIILSLAAATVFCACQKTNSPVSEIVDVEFTVGAAINEVTKTAYVPDTKKVYWSAGDKMGLKFTKTATSLAKNDNIALTLAGGAGTCWGTFKGKLSTSDATPDGAVMVFYYPQISTTAKSGSVTDKDNFVLGGNFPKVQNTNDVQFDPNLMYGFVTEVQGWPTTSDEASPLNVTMKNVMSVIDFTLKGEGAVKRIFITDCNTSASGMTGDYTVNIINGEFAGFASLPSGTRDCDRTIIVDLPKPIVLTSEGVHAYATVMPRAYSEGILVGLELTDGDYMSARISTPFTTESNKAYTAPVITFTSQKENGKGIYENTIYTYRTFTDARDGAQYRYVTMADGNDWMIDNLRFLPEGYTPSSNTSEAINGVWYPVVVNASGTGIAFSTDAKDVERWGYLYNPAVAFGQDAAVIYDMIVAMDIDKTMSAAEALTELKKWDNAGICPEGWHIPTEAEYTNMAKKYVSALNDASLVSLLGQQGFILKDFGYMLVGAPTAAKPNPTGFLQTFTSGKFNSTNLLLSTPAAGSGAKVNDWNKQFKAVMVNISNNTADVGNVNACSGVPVRCIRAAQDN